MSGTHTVKKLSKMALNKAAKIVEDLAGSKIADKTIKLIKITHAYPQLSKQWKGWTVWRMKSIQQKEIQVGNSPWKKLKEPRLTITRKNPFHEKKKNYVTRNWLEINDKSRGTYNNVRILIKFKTTAIDQAFVVLVMLLFM